MVEPEDVRLFHTTVPLIGLAVIIAISVILMVQQFQRSLFKRRLNEENLKLIHQRELLRTSIAVQEQERKRIAGDLHDELGARLSMTLMLLRECNRQIATKLGEAAPYTFQVEEQLKQALEATKRISYELMPPQLVNLGLVQALQVLTAEIRQSSGINITLDKNDCRADLPWQVQLGLYRMLSELLNNTLKHSGATAISIVLKEQEEWQECNYHDNGKGILPGEKNHGLGMKSLEGRAHSLHGTFEWGNAPEGGFLAKICLPINMHTSLPASPTYDLA